MNGSTHRWPLKFTYVGLMFWVIGSVQLIVGAIPSVSSLTDFTWFTVAQKNVWVYGFFALTMFGAMYYLMPRVMDIEWPSPSLISAHFWLTFGGVLLSYIALLVGGIAEGYLLSNPQNSFLVVLKTTLAAIRVSTIGDLLLVVGQIAGLLNLLLLAVRAAGRELKVTKRMNFGPFVFIGVFCTMLISWATFVFGPQVQIGGIQPAAHRADRRQLSFYRTGAEKRGLDIYRANNCAACHTQQVRPADLGPDLMRGWASATLQCCGRLSV